MQTIIKDTFTQENYNKIASQLELDLFEYFKIIQSEIEVLINKSITEGISEKDLEKQIDLLFGGAE
jgi:predicted metal-binding transcription factor (methanogenesis marker protein 9)